MKKPIDGIIILFLILAAAGIVWGVYVNKISPPAAVQKAGLYDEASAVQVGDDTLIVLELFYSRCGNVVISNFENRAELTGKSLEDITKILTAGNGYQVSLEDHTLLIRQTVDDWCQVHKDLCRLKEYQGRVAIYKGPDARNDTLLKVTGIVLSALPPNVQAAIRAGEYEFENEDVINDALENFDEYQ
ncbi:MAG: hypothetical protein LBR98_01840 [Syntrophomonadaceae bacterium]|jgi:hypothetical protein|nr:hypothetical protein [Syntrophomonadaceae bacterium]